MLAIKTGEISFLFFQHIIQFLIGLCEKSSSNNEFLDKLNKTGVITMNNRMMEFAQQLYDKVEHI